MHLKSATPPAGADGDFAGAPAARAPSPAPRSPSTTSLSSALAGASRGGLPQTASPAPRWPNQPVARVSGSPRLAQTAFAVQGQRPCPSHLLEAARPAGARTLAGPDAPPSAFVPPSASGTARRAGPRRAPQRSRTVPPPVREGAARLPWLALGQRVRAASGDIVTVTAVPEPGQCRQYSVRFEDGRTASLPSSDIAMLPSSRIYCPVPGCPCSDARLGDGWQTLATLRAHLDAAHCSRPEERQIPDAWLRDNDRKLCPECGLLCSASRQCCRRCWPARRAAAEGAARADVALGDLPPLAEVHAEPVPTLKHVPAKARVRWARALRTALARGARGAADAS